MSNPLLDAKGKMIFGAFDLESDKRSWHTVTTLSSSSTVPPEEVVDYIIEHLEEFEIAPIQPAGLTLIGPALVYYEKPQKALSGRTVEEIVYVSGGSRVTVPLSSGFTAITNITDITSIS